MGEGETYNIISYNNVGVFTERPIVFTDDTE